MNTTELVRECLQENGPCTLKAIAAYAGCSEETAYGILGTMRLAGKVRQARMRWALSNIGPVSDACRKCGKSTVTGGYNYGVCDACIKAFALA